MTDDVGGVTGEMGGAGELPLLPGGRSGRCASGRAPSGGRKLS